ncbi:ABC transporter permease [Actinoplanes sp. NPDC051851]|uniref:ABC transporter permease n=1 Tax=Actinoplanes sp. NPDC051851 TaxID=3154753 RepID=UPI00343513C0
MIGLAVVGVLLLLWEIAGRAGRTGLFPPFTDALAALTDLLTWDSLRTDVLPSVGRALTGFALAVLFGTLIGVTLGWFRRLEPWIRPALEFLRAVPPPAVLPVAVLTLGATGATRIAVIAGGAVWPVLIAAHDATRTVEPGYLDVARVSGLRPAAILRRVVLPAVLPALLAGARIALGIALIMMVISEMIAATAGLGYVILQSQRMYAVDQMYAGILLLGTLGWLITALFTVVERRLLGWYRR